MSMTHAQFLNAVIDGGIDGAKKDYAQSTDKLRGAIAGFEACRGKSVQELGELLSAARTARIDALDRKIADYWWYRCYESEVEWVCNCVSASLYNMGMPIIIPPTGRGMIRAAQILGTG